MNHKEWVSVWRTLYENLLTTFTLIFKVAIDVSLFKPKLCWALSARKMFLNQEQLKRFTNYVRETEEATAICVGNTHKPGMMKTSCE